MLWKKIINQIKNALLDSILPSSCIGCGKENVLLCSKCQSKIIIFDSPLCFSCRKRTPTQNFNEIKMCHPKNRIGCIFAATNYSDPIIKDAIQKYKYKNVSGLNKFLSSLMIRSLENFMNHLSLEEKNQLVIIPVPLHPKKEKSRGFNQSFLIAKIASDYFHIPLDTTSLKRTKNTLPQAQIKNKGERLKNMENAFQLSGSADLKNKNILLIDDILTTGATLDECAKALKQGGVKKIIAAVLAN